MISLAVSDLLGTFSIPLLFILSVKSVDISDLGNLGCQFISWFGTTSLTVSSLSLVAISVDRLMIVIWPYRHRPRPWKVGIIVFFIWITASFLGLIYFFRAHYSPQWKTCRVKYKDNKEDIIHTISLFLVQMLLPFLIMSVMYGIILHRLRSHSVRRLSVHSGFFAVRQERNRRSTKLFLTVVIVFFVLTLPFSIFYIWYTMNREKLSPENTTIQHVYLVLTLLWLSNSCVNPLIYARLHKSFRQNTLVILCPCFVKRFPSLRDRSDSTISSSSLRWSSGCHSTFSKLTEVRRHASLRRNTLPSPLEHSNDQAAGNSRTSCEGKAMASVQKDEFSSPAPANTSDIAFSLNPLEGTSTGVVTLHLKNGCSKERHSAGMLCLKADHTVDLDVRKASCILRPITENSEPQR